MGKPVAPKTKRGTIHQRLVEVSAELELASEVVSGMSTTPPAIMIVDAAGVVVNLTNLKTIIDGLIDEIG